MLYTYCICVHQILSYANIFLCILSIMMQLVLFAKVARICYMALLAPVACFQRIEAILILAETK